MALLARKPVINRNKNEVTFWTDEPREIVAPEDNSSFTYFETSYTYPLEITLDKVKYTYLGVGSSMIAYRSEDDKWVYKEPYGQTDAVNSVDRLIRILGKVRSNHPTRACEHVNQDGKKVTGIIMPYYKEDEKPAKKGKKPEKIVLTEEQRIWATVDFFEQTQGYVLCDAYVSGNILLSNKQVEYPDVGDAFDFELGENNSPKSPTSHYAWHEEDKRKIYQNSLRKVRSEQGAPKLAATIQALIALKENFPDLTESVLWLKNSNKDVIAILRNELADVFENDKKLSDVEIEALREKIIAVSQPTHTRTESVFASGDEREGSLGVTPAASPATHSFASPATHSFASPATHSFAGSIVSFFGRSTI